MIQNKHASNDFALYGELKGLTLQSCYYERAVSNIMHLEKMNLISNMSTPRDLIYFFFVFSGDQLAIGKETGRRLGMGTNMYPSSALLGQDKDESISALPIDELIEKADGFAGVFPGMFAVDCFFNTVGDHILDERLLSIGGN